MTSAPRLAAIAAAVLVLGIGTTAAAQERPAAGGPDKITAMLLSPTGRPRARQDAYRAPLAHALPDIEGAMPRLRTCPTSGAEDHPRVALVGPVGPCPVRQHNEAITEPDQEEQVRAKPEPPREQPRQFQAAQIDDRGPSPNSG